MNLTAIAIDDEPHALKAIQMLAEDLEFVDLQAVFHDARKALSFLHTANIDLVFLDMRMPDMTGLQFLEALPKPPMVIFTTGHSEYAEKGFDVGIIDFLRKPISFERFVKACGKALEQKKLRSNEIPVNEPLPQQSESSFLFINTGGYNKEKIMLNEILFIEATGDNYPDIVLLKGKRSIRKSLNDLQKLLPVNRFIRVNRSFIVAIDKVDTVTPYDLIVGGRLIPFGSAYEKAAKLVLNRFNLD